MRLGKSPSAACENSRQPAVRAHRPSLQASCKLLTRSLLAVLFCVVVCASAAFGQAQRPTGYTTVLPAQHMAPADSLAAQMAPATAVPLVPGKSFTYTITASSALGGGAYPVTILGRNPLTHASSTTVIPTQIVPLIITIDDGTTTVTYDPTAPDSCVPGNPTDVAVMSQSPVLTRNPWTINGVFVGDTQYVDAFQRAQFWSSVQGNAYHVILAPTTLPGQPLSFSGSTKGTNLDLSLFGLCGTLGVVNMNAMDRIVRELIAGPLASMVNAGTFPLFLTKEVVESQDGVSPFIGCCVLGYHSGLFVGSHLQIYGLFSVDGSGLFGPGYTSTFSHEVAEAINDPTTRNPTPPWGNVGQTVGQCQANLEVGDPLSEGFGTPTNPFTTTETTNGLTYASQELAYYSWFYGSSALGVGAGGLYSDNGSFTGPAILCPPGGTN
jgi:hypothetical protein